MPINLFTFFAHNSCSIEIMKQSQPCSLQFRIHSLTKRRVARLLGIAALTSSFALTPAAKGYALEGGSPRWSPGSVTFVLSLGAGRTLSDGSTFDSSGAAGLGIWNQYMQSVQINIVTNDSAPVSDRDGVNSVAFATSFFGDSFGSNTLGITGYSFSGGRMTEADTLLNSRYTWDSYRGPLRGPMDIRRVLIHEIGHALGLDHPDQHGQHVAAVMNSIVSNTDTAVTDDINGIQAIYGARTGGGGSTPTPTPLPSATPTPNPTATPSLRAATISTAAALARAGQTATFTVSLSSASTSPVTVFYLNGGSARTSFYTLSGIPGRVTIPAGSTTGSFTLTVNQGPRRPKTVTIYLLNGTGYTVSSPRSATVTISR
jgi:hypothetical protein